MSEPVCPLRTNPADSRGCCRWDHFIDDFVEHYKRWFDAPPTLKVWQAARRDWLRGNTGFEAAHNAQARAKECAAAAVAKPLVWLGGRNYAEAGSAFAIKYGKPKGAA